MNILFLMKFRLWGGIEVVTRVLANKFVGEGHRVCIYSFAGGTDFPGGSPLLDGRVGEVFHERGRSPAREIRGLLVRERTDVVINQWGLPFYYCREAWRAGRSLRVPMVSVYHNSPDANTRVAGADIALSGSGTAAGRAFWSLWRRAAVRATSWSMRYVYGHSAAYVLLSESFREKFAAFAGVGDGSRVRVIPNPLTVRPPGAGVRGKRKEKEVIYVGRIDYNQKRVHRVVDVWSMLEGGHPDWRLTVVGDGPGSAALRERARGLGLRRVSFEGFRNPEEYYERASILCLASEYEGFPLVLAESMSYGVVPVVYGSFSAVYDIISPGRDGFVVGPDAGGGFDAAAMRDCVERLMDPGGPWKAMSERAAEKAGRFSVGAAYSRWMRLFKDLNIR